MKKLLAIFAMTTALCLPALAGAEAKTVTLSTTLNSYGGNGAYLAYYVTDAKGNYAGSLWMAGGKTRYYQHLGGWYDATGGDTGQISGITGASVGSGRKLKLSMDLADTLFDAGYTLHIDAAVENMRESPDDISIPLTKAGAGKAFTGSEYIAKFSYTM